MSDKCEKFEALFTFSDEKELLEHIEQCEDCRKEYEKMQKVSALIKEVKPKFKKNNNLVYLKAACAMLMIMVCGISANVMDEQYGIFDVIRYGDELTMSDLGIPTDSYGLIQVDE